MLREHNITGGTKLSDFFCLADPVPIDNDDTCLTSPDGSLILIKKMVYNRDDEKLHIEGQATVGTIITIINADTDEILLEGIKAREGKWKAEIESVGSTPENITVMTSNRAQLARRSKIVKMTMMIMTINVKRVAERLPPLVPYSINAVIKNNR